MIYLFYFVISTNLYLSIIIILFKLSRLFSLLFQVKFNKSIIVKWYEYSIWRPSPPVNGRLSQQREIYANNPLCQITTRQIATKRFITITNYIYRTFHLTENAMQIEILQQKHFKLTNTYQQNYCFSPQCTSRSSPVSTNAFKNPLAKQNYR